MLNEPYMVRTPAGKLVVANRVYRNCPTMLLNRVSHMELVELDLVHFYVVLGMDLLHAFFSYID